MTAFTASFDALDWAAFAGRLHPVVLHLPIGLFAAVLLLEVVSWKSAAASGARRWVTVLGGATAIAAAASGYLLSLEGGYDAELVDEHFWQGLGVAVFFVLLAVLELRGRRGGENWARRALLLLLGFAVYTAGHHGGMMTHGATFLSSKAPEWLAPFVGHGEEGEGDDKEASGLAAGADPLAAAAFAALELKCVRCHGPERTKGGLRLDDPNDLLTVVEPFDAPASELFRRVTLPRAHGDFMPTDGAPLTDAEVLSLMHWINAGAKVEAVAAAHQERELGAAERAAFLDELRARTSAVIEERDDGALRVDFSRRRGAVEAGALAALDEAADAIVELSLAGRALDAEAVAALPRLDALRVLRIERSNADDAALAALLERAPDLVELNAHTTPISGASVDAIAALASLERAWLADTGLAEGDLERLRVALPDAEITGDLALPDPPAVEGPIPPAPVEGTDG